MVVTVRKKYEKVYKNTVWLHTPLRHAETLMRPSKRYKWEKHDRACFPHKAMRRWTLSSPQLLLRLLPGVWVKLNLRQLCFHHCFTIGVEEVVSIEHHGICPVFQGVFACVLVRVPVLCHFGCFKIIRVHRCWRSYLRQLLGVIKENINGQVSYKDRCNKTKLAIFICA